MSKFIKDFSGMLPDTEQDYNWREEFVEDWELLGLDPDTPREILDQAWEDQMT